MVARVEAIVGPRECGCGRGCVPRWPKRCSCGVAYDASQWQTLRLAGVQHMDGVGPDLELRDCAACRSTLAVER